MFARSLLAPYLMNLLRSSVRLLALCMALACAVAADGAGAQTLLEARSSIHFVSRQMGVPVEGRFRRFKLQGRFDPQRPAHSAVQLDIDLGSVEIGHADTERELRKPGWFDAERHPIATFRSTRVQALGDDRFDVEGLLRLKGRERAVRLPVRLQRRADHSVASGSLSIRRLDFQIGDGEWNDLSIVANEVQVHFNLALRGLPAP